MLPWSGFWDKNFFAGTSPVLERLFASAYVRGAVSGVGVITACAGVVELAGAFVSRKSRVADVPKPGV